MRARAFPGKREEANRAGITPRIRGCTIDVSIARGVACKKFPGAGSGPEDRLELMPVKSNFSVNEVDITVWEWPGADPPVMFCHATGFHSRCWDQVIAHLPGRHCYALDFRGHAHRTKLPPPYPWRNFGQDLAELAVALDLSGAIGVGHSMGGHSVTLAAALRPDAFAALLLIDPVIRSRGTYTGPWPEAQFAAKRRNQWSSTQE